MKLSVLFLAFLAAGRLAFATDEVAPIPLECDGRKFVYLDLVQMMIGGPAEHFILVHEDSPEFKDVRLQLEAKPYRPSVPYLTLGKVTLPLSHIGVYRLKKDSEGFVVDFMMADLPKRDARESVEEFIRLVLQRPVDQKEFVGWMRAYIGRK